MNNKNIIKMLIIVGIIFLFLSCYNNQNEHFDQKIEDNLESHAKSDIPLNLSIRNNNGELYSFISFENLKPEWKYIVVRTFMSKDINNKFIYIDFINNEDIFNSPNIDISKYNPENTTFIKTPIFITKFKDFDKYAINGSKFRFKLIKASAKENKYYLQPIINNQLIEKYIYSKIFNNNTVLFHSNIESPKYIFAINSNGFIDAKKEIINKYIKKIDQNGSLSLLTDNGDIKDKATLVFSTFAN